MIARILLPALIAGVLAGLLATAVQSYRVVPLILEAELYENAEGGHSHGESVSDADSHSDSETTANHPHEQAAIADEPEAWAPEDGIERVFYTAVSNILIGVAFAMLLTAAILLTNSSISARSGLIWGAAGFIIFVLAPNFGLPPELPGMDAADLIDRQLWWFSTVIATGAALYLFAFRAQPVWLLVGAVLIVAPHLYGAPMPESHESAVPSNLAAEFATATIVSSLLFWLALGGLLGWLVERAKTANSAST